MIKKYIVVKHQFEALHRWENMPKDHPMQFLSDYHRHIFHIVCKWEVSHNNRDLEFFVQKQKMVECCDRILQENSSSDCPLPKLNLSCEMIAEVLLKQLECSFVSVFEDDENGAELYNT